MTQKQTTNAELFERLLERSDLQASGTWQYRKLESGGYMPLHLDRLGSTKTFIAYAMAHNSVQHGDLMADPDMEVHYYRASDEAPARLVAMHYQNDYMGVFNSVEQGNARQDELDSFLHMWLKNLLDQGHKLNG